MNRCGVWCVIILSLSLFAPTGHADDTAPPAPGPINPAYKTGAADPSAHEDEIIGQINQQLDALATSTDPSVVSASRQWLMNQAVFEDNPSQTTSNYYDVYTDALNKAFTAALSKASAPVRLRINAALIVADVTQKTRSENLLPTLVGSGQAPGLLNDNCDAVAMLAERAGGAMIKFATMHDVDLHTLLTAMIKCVVEHPNPPLAGAIAQEAYTAFNPTLHGGNLPDDKVRPLAEANLDLQTKRVQLYIKQVPEDPYADTYASAFLFSPSVWATLSEQQKLQAQQNASDLISLYSQHVGLEGSQVDANLTYAMSHEAQYLLDMGLYGNDRNVTTALQNISQLSAASPVATVHTDADALYPALSQPLMNLKAPPTIASKSSTAPSSSSMGSASQ